jgi:hypothetical protein
VDAGSPSGNATNIDQPNGYAASRATIRQQKAGHPVRFEITEQARLAIDAYLRKSPKKPGDTLFTSRNGKGQRLSTRQCLLPRSASIAAVICWPRSASIAAICAAGVELGGACRAQCVILRYAFAPAHQGDAHLSQDRQSARGASVPRCLARLRMFMKVHTHVHRRCTAWSCHAGRCD